MKPRARLIAVDGANGRTILAAAGRLAPRGGPITGISRWDASGLFEQLLVTSDDEVAVSPRLLLLLYAADLAFRLRWEIEPALAEGRQVVAAPYVETAVAFGRACGLPKKWLERLFLFARTPAERHIVGAAAAPGAVDGFVEFACRQLAPTDREAGRTIAAATLANLDGKRRTRTAPRSGGRHRVGARAR